MRSNNFKQYVSDDEFMNLRKEVDALWNDSDFNFFDKNNDIRLSINLLNVSQHLFNTSLQNQNINHKVYFFVINSPKFNAFVKPSLTDNNSSIVGINYGIILLCRIFFLILALIWKECSNNENHLMIDSLHKNRKLLNKLKKFEIDKLLTAESDTELIKRLKKILNHKDLTENNNYLFVDYGTYFCIEYLLYHELSHLIQGHTFFLHNKYNLSIYEEVTPVNKIDIDDRILLELLADHFVGKVIANVILLKSSPFLRGNIPQLTEGDLLEIWSLSIVFNMTTLAILDERKPFEKVFLPKKYPHAAFRMRILFEALARIFKNNSWRFDQVNIEDNWINKFMISQKIVLIVFSKLIDKKYLVSINPGPVMHFYEDGIPEFFRVYVGFSSDAELIYRKLVDESNLLQTKLKKYSLPINEFFV